MNTTMIEHIQSEGRLLYALLDAADEAGRLNPGTVARWREVKALIMAGASYESQAELLHEVLSELGAKGAFSGTWLEQRWCAVKSRAGDN